MSSAAALFVLLVVLATPLGAQESFTISLEGIATGAEGEIVELANEAVPANLIGSTCNVMATTQNNGSVHQGNIITVASETGAATIPGAEEVPGQTISGTGTVELGTTVQITMQFGPDGATSGGIILSFDCQASAQTTTTVAQATTTTTETPIGPIDTGAGGTASTGSSVPTVAAVLFALVLLSGGFFIGNNGRVGS